MVDPADSPVIDCYSFLPQLSNLLKLAALKLNIQITICTDTVKYNVNIKYSTIKYRRITNTKKIIIN